jgi:alcohol dehydrogenase
MADISFASPSRVLFGLDSINRLGTIVAEHGDRAIVVTEAILYESNTIERIETILEKRNISAMVFDEVIPNATSSVVDDGVHLARGAHANLVVGLGGVRALSIARCVAMVTPRNSHMDDFMSGMQPQGEALPYIEVPTTCRNPFMLVDEYFVADGRDRTGRPGRTQPQLTKAVVIDPKLAISLPQKYTATTLMDTLLAAIEGYTSTRANPLTDTLFAESIRLIARERDAIVSTPDNLKGRSDAAMAGLLNAVGFTMSRQGIGAALAYAINARFMVPKSWVAAILIPHVLEFHANAAAEKIAAIAVMLGEDISGLTTVDAAARAADAARRIMGALGLPTRLREFGLTIEDMVDVAAVARGYDILNYVPRAASTDDLYELIKSAF